MRPPPKFSRYEVNSGLNLSSSTRFCILFNLIPRDQFSEYLTTQFDCEQNPQYFVRDAITVNICE